MTPARRTMVEQRELLETWFARYPRGHRAHLRGRLFSSRVSEQQSAWWELYLHETFMRAGYTVHVSVETPASRSMVPVAGSKSRRRHGSKVRAHRTANAASKPSTMRSIARTPAPGTSGLNCCEPVRDLHPRAGSGRASSAGWPCSTSTSAAWRRSGALRLRNHQLPAGGFIVLRSALI